MINQKGIGTRVPVIAIDSLRISLPFYPSISAGFPSPADDYIEEQLDLENHLVTNREATFFVRVKGLSMTGAGIYPNDILVVDRALEPKNRDVVIAALNGEFTVKRWVCHKGKYYLKPENPDFQTVEVGEHSEFLMWGVVTFVIHKPYEL